MKQYLLTLTLTFIITANLGWASDVPDSAKPSRKRKISAIASLDENLANELKAGTESDSESDSERELETKSESESQTMPISKADPDIIVHAARSGNLKFVKQLVKEGADTTYSDTKYGTPLLAAAARGHLKVVKYLLKSTGAPIEVPDQKNSTPLIRAAYWGDAEMVRLLLENKAMSDISVSSWRYSALLTAALASTDENGRNFSLTDEGRSKYIFDLDGEEIQRRRANPSRVNYSATIEALLNDSDLAFRNSGGRNVLSLLAENGDAKSIEVILKKIDGLPNKADIINDRDDEGRSALIWASRNGHRASVRKLLDAGIDVNYRNNIGGESAVSAAAEGTHIGTLCELTQANNLTLPIVNFAKQKAWSSVLENADLAFDHLANTQWKVHQRMINQARTLQDLQHVLEIAKENDDTQLIAAVVARTNGLRKEIAANATVETIAEAKTQAKLSGDQVLFQLLVAKENRLRPVVEDKTINDSQLESTMAAPVLSIIDEYVFPTL